MRALTAVAPHPQLVSLLDVDHSLARDIPMTERALARRALMLPVTTLDRGPWPGPAAAGATTPWMLVLDGLLATEATVGRRPVVHLLGPGDLVVPPPADADAVLA